jgi:Holliday junction resolvase RusA-like endonuclease
MNRLVLPFAPMAKPRQTQRDRWKERPVVVKYRRWADAARAFATRQRFDFPEAGASIHYRIPMPASWSKRKRVRMEGAPHQQKPDVDNLTKAIMDALLPGGDERVWHLAGQRKTWAVEGSVEITVEPITAREGT